MTLSLPTLTEFRVEPQASGTVHLVFDCPDRSMNVFSNRAIEDLGRFAEWLHGADALGVVVRSGKSSGFCAGADLTELGVAYDMIVAAPPADRFDLAFDHFFRLSHAIRRLETAGKPVAAAIAGVALGGGCELALGCHHRVLADDPRAFMGLPESGVGLLPGAGGTQRMPRLVGLDLGLEILLEGRNLKGEDARVAGLADALVPPGSEVEAAEAWVLSEQAHATQPWDRKDSVPPDHAAIAPALDRHQKRELARMLGHEPAPLAILACIELGMLQPIDGAVRSEMSVFAGLIQRPEPRNMIRTLFLGKQAYDRAAKQGQVDARVLAAAATARARLAQIATRLPGIAQAGFLASEQQSTLPSSGGRTGLWIAGEPDLTSVLKQFLEGFAQEVSDLDELAMLQLDHLLAREGIVPAYLGGFTGMRAHAKEWP